MVCPTSVTEYLKSISVQHVSDTDTTANLNCPCFIGFKHSLHITRSNTSIQKQMETNRGKIASSWRLLTQSRFFFLWNVMHEACVSTRRFFDSIKSLLLFPFCETWVMCLGQSWDFWIVGQIPRTRDCFFFLFTFLIVVNMRIHCYLWIIFSIS